jgi:RimJ/RimL family protein N-acetyltransferase
MQLSTPRLLLREFCDSDLSDLYAIYGDNVVQRFEQGRPDTLEETRARLEASIRFAAEKPRRRWYFAVTHPRDNWVIGRVSLRLQAYGKREYEIGWTVHRSYWGQGIASEAAGVVLDFAFRNIGAHRVVAFCNAENRASERVMQKLGMTKEGHLREAIWLGDRWWDELVYAILEQDVRPGS